ncbi:MULTISPECIES: flagellar biosynthetic protein FliO [unclassified Fusibacter]|uniref:flagellar biosynthetic protein FliO n=1 Tax=unclassified Fusibacter TaxID=2624464 RepID=UPI0010111817|nr:MULTISPECIES: flagellar biosynthetic protein FliO [unclassified Fusibacter]MCK8058771.1 flagellar biosynthetic protein FliO [Fusibacter sp. A2]NPE21845.1 flagellar biosynthetic protein FliO [Fusibacter sp. A1]RXV61417.1 hypothetical protein DWB64_08375 [Fusibacter sp. A1]
MDILIGTSEWSKGTFGVVSYFMFIVAVVVLAFGTTRYISTMYAKGVQSRNIKIIEKVNLAADKSLWLIELGEKVYFAYSDKNGMQMLDQVSPELLNLQAKESTQSFSNVLKKVMNKKQEKL